MRGPKVKLILRLPKFMPGYARINRIYSPPQLARPLYPLRHREGLPRVFHNDGSNRGLRGCTMLSGHGFDKKPQLHGRHAMRGAVPTVLLHLLKKGHGPHIQLVILRCAGWGREEAIVGVGCGQAI